MINDKLTKWCRTAAAQIRYGPDRAEVEAELLAHMEDKYDTLRESGLPEEEITENILRSMGSAEAIAPQLAAVHRPFWGYLLQFSRRLLVILLCLCIIPCWLYFSDLHFGSPSHRDFDVFSADSYGGDTGRHLLHLSQPDVSVSSDGSIFTLTDAAVFTEVSKADGETYTRLYIRILQQSLLPVTEQGEYYDYFAVAKWFHVTDSLGNRYPSFMNRGSNGNTCLNPGGAQTGIFTYTHECWINDFQGTDADWVDICYDRDGRSLTLRVYLKGGGR